MASVIFLFLWLIAAPCMDGERKSFALYGTPVSKRYGVMDTLFPVHYASLRNHSLSPSILASYASRQLPSIYL